MTISKFFVAALVATAVNAVAAAPVVTLSGVTGVVQIKTSEGTMTIKAGQPIPELPPGAEIVVVSGGVTVTAGGVVIKADAGDSFTVATHDTGAVDVSVTGGKVSVTDANGAKKDVAKGEGVTVASAPTPAPKPVVPAPKTEEKTEAAEESLPADDTTTDDTTQQTTQQQTSPTQEIETVSPSAP